MAVTILLADDHHVMRQGLRMLLEAQEDFRVVAEAGDGLEAVKLAECLKPNVLIVDLMMPGLNGLEVARQVSHHSPQTRIIMLSMYGNEPYVLEALRNGAAGYVLKDADATELLRAVHEVVAGRVVSHRLGARPSRHILCPERKTSGAQPADRRFLAGQQGRRSASVRAGSSPGPILGVSSGCR